MTNLMADYGWFLRTSSRNRARRFKAQIKSPRYAFALLFGAAYFFFIVVFPYVMRSHSRGGAAPPDAFLSISRGAGALGLAILAATWWLWRTDQGILLTPAEANLLVPAPITRKQLIQFKLIGAQPGILMSAAFISLLTHSSHLPIGMRMLGAWCLVTTLQLHRYGASLVHTSLSEHGGTGWRRVWPAAIIFAAMLGTVLWSIAGAYRTAGSNGLGMRMVFDRLATPPASIALAPFHAVLAAMNAIDVHTWYRAFPISVAIVVLHYFWVIRMDAAFEETAAATGVKRAAAVEAIRANRGVRFRSLPKEGETVRAPWFPLAEVGNPVVAILWKNVLGVTRGISPKMLMRFIPVVIGILVFMKTQDHSKGGMLAVIGVMAMSYSLMITLIGPMRIRHDFRADLQRIQLIRTLPIGGAHLAIAEVTTSAVLVSLIQMALLSIGLGALIMAGKVHDMKLVSYAALPAIIAIFAMNSTMVTIHNIAAVSFPAWTSKPGGIEMFGIMMMAMIGGAIILLLSLVGPAIVGFSAVTSMGLQWGRHAYIPGGAGVIIGMYAQLLLLLQWLGRSYDKMDTIERSQS